MVTRRTGKYQYDVFLSHNSGDKDAVERIASELEDKAGLKPFLDKWHLIPGEPWQESLEEALDLSAVCAVFLGPLGIGPWENEEMRSALEDRVGNKSFRVIPILLPGADPKDPDTLPRFVRRLTWVDYRPGLSDSRAFHNLVAGIRGNAPGRNETPKLSTYSSMIVHALPPAPMFVGRTRELEILDEFWQTNRPGVLSLVGIGGAGKTAIVAEFLDRLAKRADHSGFAASDAIFVWSFYADQEIGVFLEAALDFFRSGEKTEARGSGALYLLANSLSRRGRCLIVMDGLERIQQSRSDQDGILGELENPLFRQVISRLALGVGQSKCIITSRFPIADLHPWAGKGYSAVDVDQLERPDARSLFRLHGIKGDDDALDHVIDQYGAHALTLDHLATYLCEFCRGDPRKAEDLEEPRIDSDIRQERNLAKVLFAYKNALTPKELALLSRLCLFHFGVEIDTMHRIFSRKGRSKLASGPLVGMRETEFQRLFKYLIRLHLVLEESRGRYTIHPAIRDYFYHLFTKPKVVHGAVYDYLFSLVTRSGVHLPKDKEALDLLEEVIYQSIQIGNPEAAEEVFDKSLGGSTWLVGLGEISRGYRISNAFPKNHSMNKYEKSIFLRYLGDPQLYADTYRGQNDALILLGMLRQASNKKRMGWDIAEFLMGKRKDLVDVSFHGDPITSAHTYLYRGELSAARVELDSLKDMIAPRDDYGRKLTFVDEESRFDLLLAEIERQEGHLGRAEQKIKKAEKWILASGSQEHLCVLHLTQARLSTDKRRYETAQAALTEGLHIAERCKFGLYHIDLLNEQGRLYVLQGKMKEAQRVALCALNGMLEDGEPAPRPDLPLKKQRRNSPLSVIGAKHPECQYVWGEAQAGHLLGQALMAQEHVAEARNVLQHTLTLRTAIRDHLANQTRQLLASCKTNAQTNRKRKVKAKAVRVRNATRARGAQTR